MDDNQIVESILNGDIEHFTFLVNKHQDMVFKTCMGFLHNTDDANDVTQEVFINVFQNLNKFNQKSALSTWIYRIAVNASLNEIRKNKNNLFQRIENLFTHDVNPAISLKAENWDTPESSMITSEEEVIVAKEIDKLSEKQKIAFVLSRCENLPQKEVAAIMEISEGAVESLIQRAKANLSKNLSVYFKKN